MQTILGANGQIGTELARALHTDFTQDLRLVSRRPQKVNATDQTMAADLLDPQQTLAAIAGSDIVYLTVGLPANSALWAQQLPTMMRNVIAGCQAHQAKLVFFDNTYMYPKSAATQTEDTAFEPHGSKSETRASMVELLLGAMRDDAIEAVICRAPEFYGPAKTQGVTNSLILDRIAAGKSALIPISDTTLRTLIWTPDASRAMALIGNTTSAFGQTWHLPVDSNRRTYAQLIELCAEAWDRPISARVVKQWQFRLLGLFNKEVRELEELLPRYAVDNIFSSDKFDAAFPDFPITSYADGIAAIAGESQ